MSGSSGRAHGAAMRFEQHGAQHFGGVLDDIALGRATCGLVTRPSDAPGLRLRDVGSLMSDLAAGGLIGSIAASILGPGATPVRAVMFDKTEAMNWKLGWHQDRTIVVASRIDVDGFGPWSTRPACNMWSPRSRFWSRWSPCVSISTPWEWTTRPC